MRVTKLLAVVAFLLPLLSAAPTADGWPQAADGIQQFAEFGDFKLQNGGVIYDFKVGYRTLGRLNSEKSNAILWPTWLGGISHDLLEFIGPGKVLDSSKYFVILVDAIGNGISSSPLNSKQQPCMKFPKFTIRDMVEAEHRLVTQVLHLSHLHAVMGVSMGGMQTFSWALAYPDFMDEAIPMAGSPQSTSFDKLLWTAEIDAIESDPAWNHGNPTKLLTKGIVLAQEIDSMNSTSPAYRVAHTYATGFDTFLSEIKTSAKADGGTASDQIRQRQAIIALDIPKDLGVTLAQTAKRVRAKLLIINSPQDHMVNPTPAFEFAAAAGIPVVSLNSSCGHRSLSCISVGPIVASFLADPSSVHSMTLHDPANP
ncbi:MAG: alpha/beta fold hydrolase [Candidatus Acidiferrum sp.]